MLFSNVNKTNARVGDLGISEFQEKLKCSTRKTELYAEMREELAKAGFRRMLDQIIGKF